MVSTRQWYKDKVNEEAEYNRSLIRPGEDDNLSLLEHLSRVRKMKKRWGNHPVHNNIKDAIEQSDAIKSERDEEAERKRYYMETNGKTEEEYYEFRAWSDARKARKKQEWREAERNHIIIERGER